MTTPGEVFALRLALALRRYGTPAHRLEDAMTTFSARTGLTGSFYVLPTAILATTDAGTRLVPISIGATVLERLVQVDALAEEVAVGARSPEQGLQALGEIEASGSRYPWWLTWLAPAVVSGGAAPLFGGGLAEIVVAAIVGTTCAGLGLLLRPHPEGGRLYEVLCGLIAAWLVHAFALASGGFVVPEIALLAGIIVLLPGLTLTVAFTELATRHMISGTSGVVAATLTLLQLGFGVALGGQLATAILGPLPVLAAPMTLPLWAVGLSVVALGAGLTVDLQARPRDLPFIAVALAVAMAGARLGVWLLGGLGAAVGACLLTLVSNTLARIFDRPAAITQVPGILLLVPGSIGFRSVSALLDQDVVGGVEAAFTTVMAAVGLVVGILLANALVKPRRSL